MKRTIFCVVLVLALLVSMLPTVTYADAYGESAIAASIIDSLKAKFPAGKYWNHSPNGPVNSDAWTDYPCTHHDYGNCSAYDGRCGCNMYDKAVQCMGFAYKLASECFNTSARKWTQVYSLSDLKAGDIVRVNGHSIFVTAVQGELVTYADCNNDHQCGIRWDAQMSKSVMQSRLDYRLVSPNQMVPASPRLTVGSAYHQWDTVTALWNPVGGVDYYSVSLLCDGITLASTTTTNCNYSFEAKIDGVYTISVSSVNSIGRSPESMSRFVVDVHNCPSKDFWDVPNYDNWSHEGIDYAVSTGLFNGLPDGSFSPDGMMTRAMIATVLWRNSGSPSVTGVSPYQDVANDAWYARAVIWAYQNQIMNGMGEGLFQPDVNLNREQIVTVMYRYASYKGAATDGQTALNWYADYTTVSPWAESAMKWAVANKIIQGSTENNRDYLNPLSPANRAQVATILMRFVRDYIRVPALTHYFS